MRTQLLPLLFGWCFLNSIHAQGPLDGYLKGKGVLDIAPSFSFLSAEQFDGNGPSYALPYRGNLINVFAEYGLSERLDAVATIPYVFTRQQSGFQDGAVYLKYRPVYTNLPAAGRISVLGAAGYSFPLSGYEPIAEGALGQRAQVLPLRLILQWDTPLGLFINLTGGYNFRFDRLDASAVAMIRQTRPDYAPHEPRNFATGLLRVGFPAAKFYADAWLEIQRTQGGADYVPGLPDLPQAYGVSYTQTGGSIYYSENGRSGIVLSGAYILGGRNVSRVLRLTVGGVWKLGKISNVQ